MNISEQVISPAQAQILFTLGVQAPSIFSHMIWPDGDSIIIATDMLRNFRTPKNKPAAYTVSELSRALNMDYAGNLMPSLTHFHRWMDEQHINYKSMAQLHCALLIHFIEQNVFTIEQINKRIAHQ